MKEKIAKVIRVLTIAPTAAFALLVLLYIFKPAIFAGTLNFILAIVFLALLPILAYPLSPFIPHFKDGGRDGQRMLAIIMANIGYLLGIAVMCFTGFHPNLVIIYLTYLFSGALILVINKLFKVRASGHACGVVGPVAALIYFLGMPGVFGVLLIAATYWASLEMKRHTVMELVIGSIIPVLSMLAAIGIARLLS